MKHLKQYVKGLLACFVMMASINTTKAQDKIDSTAFRILDKAMAPMENSDSYAVYFSSIAFGLAKAEHIFQKPDEELFKDGYMIYHHDKFKIELGISKAISDGKLMILSDEINKTLIVDSVEAEQTATMDTLMDQLDNIIDQEWGKATLTYQGEVSVNGIACHKIKAFSSDAPGEEALYWIKTADNTLYMMADKLDNLFTVYIIDRITKVPKKQNFDVYFPAEETSNFYGYEVLDLRYVNLDR